MLSYGRKQCENGGGRLTMMTGIPISLKSFWHSSLCCRVTLTVRRVKRSTSSAVPGCESQP